MESLSPDFQTIFEQAPVNYVVVDDEWRIVAATNGYLAMAMRTREGLIGQNILEAFPDNPDDPEAKGTEALRSGIEQAKETRKAEWLPGAVRYPIARPEDQGGGYEERWFRALNAPVFDGDGNVVYVIHGNEDVTDTYSRGDRP
ncbi:PAS domain-containing protein [Arthrobacter sp. OAP107]|uniref:PAS domain-containing protein n=1 Tax=Arthrobacter sp. OAP107 TaxID=3156445 RepID=UPI0033911570